MRRLELAHQLDPTLLYPLFTLSRHHELHGDARAVDAILAELQRPPNAAISVVNMACARIMAWRGDDASLKRWGANKEPAVPTLEQRAVWLYAQGMLGKLAGESLEERFTKLMPASSSRHVAHLHQMLTEIYARQGNAPAALRHLIRAAETIIDIEWVDLCPLFASLRGHPAFLEARRQVQARVEALMNT